MDAAQLVIFVIAILIVAAIALGVTRRTGRTGDRRGGPPEDDERQG
jgi:archaellum component FlaG (FlaF/FlaG flagellin family)